VAVHVKRSIQPAAIHTSAAHSLAPLAKISISALGCSLEILAIIDEPDISLVELAFATKPQADVLRRSNNPTASNTKLHRFGAQRTIRILISFIPRNR